MNAKTPQPTRYDPLTPEPPAAVAPPAGSAKAAKALRRRVAAIGPILNATPPPDTAAIDAQVVSAFALRGITDAQPRVNVLTFGAWCKKGRVVKKGEKAVRVGRYNLFHESQTKPLDETPGKEGKLPRDYRLVMTPGERIRVEMQAAGKWSLALTFSEGEEDAARGWVASTGGQLVEQTVPLPPEEDEPAFAAAAPFEQPSRVDVDWREDDGEAERLAIERGDDPEPDPVPSEAAREFIRRDEVPDNIISLPAPPQPQPRSWRDRLRR